MMLSIAAQRRTRTAVKARDAAARTTRPRAGRGPRAELEPTAGRAGAVGTQHLGAHVAAGEQQPDEPAPRRAIAVGHRHARYAAKVTVTVDTTVGGIWHRWRLRVPTRTRLPVVLLFLEHRGADGAAETIGPEAAGRRSRCTARRATSARRRSPRSARG